MASAYPVWGCLSFHWPVHLDTLYALPDTTLYLIQAGERQADPDYPCSYIPYGIERIPHISTKIKNPFLNNHNNLNHRPTNLSDAHLYKISTERFFLTPSCKKTGVKMFNKLKEKQKLEKALAGIWWCADGAFATKLLLYLSHGVKVLIEHFNDSCCTRQRNDCQ